MSQIERTCAALAGVLQPLTGGRASFRSVLIGPAGGVEVERNTYLVPIVDDVERFDLLLKTTAAAVVTDEGEEVDLISNVGGLAHEQIRADCPLRVLDAPPGLVEFGIVTAVLSPATAGPEAGYLLRGRTPRALGSVVIYEGHGSNVSLDFFRAHVKEFPAVVIAWEGSELADANTQASLDYGSARVGGASVLMAERFGILCFSKRLESHGIRRAELLDATDDVTDILSARQSVDGQVFSSPGGLVIHERLPQRMHSSDEFQGVYGTLLRVSVTQTAGRSEWRTYNPWVRTRIDAHIPETNEPTDPEVLPVVDRTEFLMLSSTVPDYIFEEDGQNPVTDEDEETPLTDE